MGNEVDINFGQFQWSVKWRKKGQCGIETRRILEKAGVCVGVCVGVWLEYGYPMNEASIWFVTKETIDLNTFFGKTISLL